MKKWLNPVSYTHLTLTLHKPDPLQISAGGLFAGGIYLRFGGSAGQAALTAVSYTHLPTV